MSSHGKKLKIFLVLVAGANWLGAEFNNQNKVSIAMTHKIVVYINFGTSASEVRSILTDRGYLWPMAISSFGGGFFFEIMFLFVIVFLWIGHRTRKARLILWPSTYLQDDNL